MNPQLSKFELPSMTHSFLSVKFLSENRMNPQRSVSELALNEPRSLICLLQITWKTKTINVEKQFFFAFFKLQEGFSISIVEQMEYRNRQRFWVVCCYLDNTKP